MKGGREKGRRGERGTGRKRDWETRREGDGVEGAESPLHDRSPVSPLPNVRLAPSPHRPVSPSSGLPLHPSKRLGQHFLTDQRVIDRIIKSLNPTPDETIVEIGPGRGALTTELVGKTGRVIAIEFDRNLVPLLTQQFGSFPNFKLVQSDALITDFCSEILPAKQARLVANLPYNISTAILQRLIKQRHCLPEMVLMLQREVVDRITAPAGSTNRGYLSVFVEAYCETETLFDVAPNAFRPAPKVWSSVIRLKPKLDLEIALKKEEILWQVVSAGFAQKRKTILNNLRSATGSLQRLFKDHGGASIVLCRAGIDLRRRGETLTVEEWERIAHALE